MSKSRVNDILISAKKKLFVLCFECRGKAKDTTWGGQVRVSVRYCFLPFCKYLISVHPHRNKRNVLRHVSYSLHMNVALKRPPRQDLRRKLAVSKHFFCVHENRSPQDILKFLVITSLWEYLQPDFWFFIIFVNGLWLNKFLTCGIQIWWWVVCCNFLALSLDNTSVKRRTKYKKMKETKYQIEIIIRLKDSYVKTYTRSKGINAVGVGIFRFWPWGAWFSPIYEKVSMIMKLL